jgi:hypothetical protein
VLIPTSQMRSILIAITSGRNLGVCAYLLGSLLRGDRQLSYEVLWPWASFDNLSTFALLKYVALINC